MKRKSRILTEGEKKQIIQDKEKLIINSFTKTFNKIKRIDENEIPQTRLIVDSLGVTGDGDFDAELTIMGIDSLLRGNLSNFDAVYSAPEPRTYDYPGSPGGIEEVLYENVEYDYLEFGEEFKSETPEEIIAKLSSMAPNMIEMINEAIEYDIDTKVRDGYFDTDEFIPTSRNPREDMYEEKELTDKQSKHIDVNNNGKIDAEDFKALRGMDEDVPSYVDDDMNRPPNAGEVQTYNNNIISKISSESGLTDFVFSPTVNIHGKGSLYIFAEKGDDFIEIDNIGIYADIGNYGEVDNVTYKVDYNNPDIKRLLTSFISPEQLNNLFDDAEIEVDTYGEEEGEEYDSDFSI